MKLKSKSLREVLASKIHLATITEANLNYIGSITIDKVLMDLVGIWPGQKMLVVDVTNGVRLETYAIPGKPNSGAICMNGAAAHLIKKGDKVIIMGFVISNKPVKPKIILVDKNNKFKKWL